jgi:curved DNA-binding protein CbpA
MPPKKGITTTTIDDNIYTNVVKDKPCPTLPHHQKRRRRRRGLARLSKRINLSNDENNNKNDIDDDDDDVNGMEGMIVSTGRPNVHDSTSTPMEVDPLTLITVNNDIASRTRMASGNEGNNTAVHEMAVTTTVAATTTVVTTKDTVQTLMSFSNGEQSKEVTGITQTTTTTTTDIQIPNANDIVVSKLTATTNTKLQQKQRNLTDHVNDNDHHDLHNNNNGDSCIMYEPDDEHDDIRNDSDSIRRMMDLYDIVGVEPTASIKEIDNAFLETSKYFRQFRDKRVDSTLYDLDKEIAAQKHIELVNAYALLSDPIKRRDYDISLQQQERLRRLRVRQRYKKLDAKEAIGTRMGNHEGEVHSVLSEATHLTVNTGSNISSNHHNHHPHDDDIKDNGDGVKKPPATRTNGRISERSSKRIKLRHVYDVEDSSDGETNNSTESITKVRSKQFKLKNVDVSEDVEMAKRFFLQNVTKTLPKVVTNVTKLPHAYDNDDISDGKKKPAAKSNNGNKNITTVEKENEK